ncbi:MAG: glycoside hydrolase family 9 protein [Gemmatimonadaceae bacterium]
MSARRMAIAVALAVLTIAAASFQQPEARVFTRINQLGYRVEDPKVAVVCALDVRPAARYSVVDTSTGLIVLSERSARSLGSFAACRSTHRLDFSAVRRPGTYRIRVEGAAPVLVRVGDDVYAGAADSLLVYMRQQRSGWNPVFRDSVHRRDGIVVDHATLGGRFIPVSGGWADASDYLQYVATSANATYVMLAAYRAFPRVFTDRYLANGTAGNNGRPDVLDEVVHGLEWLLKMYPGDSVLFNQLGDDRDHAFLDLLTTDSSDYGWGKGKERPLYPCTGKPQGLLRYRNRSTGFASTAGKFAATFAAAARFDTGRGALLRARAERAYALGTARPGVCQTAPAGAPYFYEEDNWVDDMELAAAELASGRDSARYVNEALAFAERERVTPWMGADTARHYQWYPFLNLGHAALARHAEKTRLTSYYREGLTATIRRANNGFRIGVPFIWCSNNLVVAFATQALLYRQLTGDTQFREYEQAAIDWLFGTNPWGVSMFIGLGTNFPRDPHSVPAKQLGWQLTGGLVDGPVYRSIFGNLLGVRLQEPDEYARFNDGFIVYHDDMGDYSTNEPTMDGTASATWLLAALAPGR